MAGMVGERGQWLSCKESACNAGDHLQCKKPKFDPWVGKIPWRRKWQPTPVFCLENPMDREAQWSTTLEVTRVGHGLVAKPPPPIYYTHEYWTT